MAIVVVEKIHPSGNVNGGLIELCCASTIEEAHKRLSEYAERCKKQKYALVNMNFAWVGVGHLFYDYKPLTGILN